ncbi:hypothetical protein HMPREF1378_01205 [Enterococcus faecium R496]|uniref:Uncharacterized protein n=1 Tax=Enterococcus faecium R496 TaxID=1134836 RepID=A0AAV3GWC0_ENTFC|nr:hypothetical protein HMPREF1378_01205 [Enterococcus faecium R496]
MRNNAIDRILSSSFSVPFSILVFSEFYIKKLELRFKSQFQF